MTRGGRARGALVRNAIFVPGLLSLFACSTLPVTGPTGRDIRIAARHASAGVPGQLPFKIIEIADASSIPPTPPVPISRLPMGPTPPTDLIGSGDVLSITIYEAGVSLFGSGATRMSAGSAGAVVPSANQGAGSERLPGVRVDDRGFIRLPFVGRLHAAGHTAAELQSMIRDRLRGMSQDPQVMVSIEQSITNSVVLAGEVNHPGRFVLTTNRETLNQTIALAGGYRGEAKDVIARVQRGGNTFEIRLSDLFDLPQRDVPIAPGDTVTLISRPESFSALGAPSRSEEIRFPRGRVSVAEAVALVGGANANAGDAAAIFIFRFVPKPTGGEEPIVYHLNMMRPGALFLSQRFMMKDNDLLYVGNAEANQPTKFVQLLSQLFIPVATVRTTVQ